MPGISTPSSIMQVHTFHKHNIFPLAMATSPPEFQVLIGVYYRFQTCMFVSYGSTLRRAFPHVAIGAGAHFAMSLIDEVVIGIKDLKHTELLAAYVVAVTKERVEGCGNHTMIVSLHNPSIAEVGGGQPSYLVPPQQVLTHVPPSTIRRWEESFASRWAPRQIGLISELIEEELATDDTRPLTSQKSEPKP